MKKIAAFLSAAAIAISSMAATAPVSSAEPYINYAEALQKSLYFYECQQAGPLPEWNRVEWRADSTMDDFIKGGWYDAGDHVKFNLPMAYSASMIAWGLYQYPDGIEECGEMNNYVNNLTFVLDYLAACDLGDEVVFQVGNGQKDHTWWGPVELYDYGMNENGGYDGRPYYSGTKCSAAFGEMAAALAAGYCALQGRSDKTDYYLEHAENIFKIADAAKSDAEYQDSDASGFYRSSHFYDELFWAANWLYKATGEKSYLDKATSYIPYLDKELGSDELKYTWSMCWDDSMQGGMLLYAQNTGDVQYVARVKKHLDYLVSGVNKLDGGLAHFHTWGCLRYAAASGFVILLIWAIHLHMRISIKRRPTIALVTILWIRALLLVTEIMLRKMHIIELPMLHGIMNFLILQKTDIYFTVLLLAVLTEVEIMSMIDRII